MPPARPLRDVFADMAGEGAAGLDAGARPEELLRAQGHEELGEDLVAEAVVNYADTAAPAVAEHLAPFVMAHSPVPSLDPAAAPDSSGWADLLATAPSPADLPELTDDAIADSGPADLDGLSVDRGFDTDPGLDADHTLYLDFGHGHEDADLAGPVVGPELERDPGTDPPAGADTDDLALSVYDGQTVFAADDTALDDLLAAVDEPTGEDADPADTIDS